MNDTFESISALRASLLSPGHTSPEYFKKMFNPVPDMESVKDRGIWLVERAKGRTVLDIGCTGKISQAIQERAAKYYGVDLEPGENRVVVDLDNQPEALPVYEDVDLVIMSEVLEHLSNPGNFLKQLKKSYPAKEIIITVPNAGSYMVKDKCEIVNKQHVAWYSYVTLKTLLTRYQYEIVKAYWYNGQPYKAEGLIMEVKS